MSYDLILNRAVQLFENGQLDDAERLFRQILETAPEQPDVLNLLGLVAQAKGAQAEACQLFYKAVMQKKDNPAFYYNLAFSLKLDGKPHEAIENFQKALSLKSDIKEAYNELGLLFQGLGDMKRAREYFNKALASDENYVEAASNLARSYEHENRDFAIEELKKIAEKYSGAALPLYYLSAILMTAKDWEQALHFALQAEKCAPEIDEIQVVLGQLWRFKDCCDKAYAHFQKAYTLNPSNVAAIVGLADVSSQTGDFDDAEKLYKRAIELDKTNFTAHQNYAEMLFKQKRKLEALEEYRQAVILNPKSAELNNNLGVALRDSRDYEQAMGLFFNALALNPTLETAAVNAVETLTLWHRQDAKTALKVAENWHKQMPDNIFAQHIYNCFTGEKSEADIRYNQRLFECFADNYELVMSSVGYTAPLAVGRIAGSVKGSVVDLGCGTGLVGQAVKSPKNHLTGVDLSEKMLRQAESKGIYDQLFCEDILSFLKKNNKFNWAIAGDVLGYLGDLEQFFAAVCGMKLIFTTEQSADGEAFRLQPNGRYQHSLSYIENLLQTNGYRNIYHENIVLRQEDGCDVHGVLWKAE